MSFSFDQTQYIFLIIYFVKTRDVEFIIDEIITILVDLQKRSNYEINNVDMTRAIKNFNQNNKNEKNNESYNNTNNEKNKKNSNRKIFIFNNNKNICICNYDQYNCDHCNFKIYYEFDCSYKHEHKRVDN